MQPAFGDARAIGKREDRQASCGLSQTTKSQALRQPADVGFVEPRFDERLPRLLARRLQVARPMVAEIVEVGAKEDVRQPQPSRDRLAEIEELALAVIAAVAGIFGEAGTRSSCERTCS